jgi:hypothetical protein
MSRTIFAEVAKRLSEIALGDATFPACGGLADQLQNPVQKGILT